MKILVISGYINLFRVCYPGRSYRVSLKKYMFKGLLKRGILHLNRAKWPEKRRLLKKPGRNDRLRTYSTKQKKKRYLAWNLQGMLVDFGIRPEEASSCGSRTSNSWMSPSTNISLRQSNLTSPSVSLEQFHIRFLGPAFAESVLTTAKRGTALCDNNFPTARRAMTILKCFSVVYLSPVLFSKLGSRILIGRCWPYLCTAVDISRLKWHGCDALVTSRTKLVVWSRCFKKRNVKMHDFKHLCLELFIFPNQAHLYLKLPN